MIRDAPVEIKSTEEIFHLIHRLESSLETEKMVIAGMDVWPSLRQNLVTRLNKLISKQDPATERLWARLGRKFSTAIASLRKGGIRWNNRPIPEDTIDVLAVTDTFAKRMMLEGKWYDVFTEPILTVLERKGATVHVLETSGSFLVREPSYRDGTKLLIQQSLWFFQSLLFSRRIQPDQKFLVQYEEYRKVLLAAGLERHTMSISDLTAEVAYVNLIMKRMRQVLVTTRPKLILLMPYTSFIGKAICRLGSEMGFRVADIQHGVQGRYHVSYGSFSKLPEGGFNVMPTHFLTWSGEDSAVIDSWSSRVKGPQAHVIGNMYQEAFLKESDLARRVDREFVDIFPSDKTLVLVSLVWSFFIPEVFLDVMRRAPENLFFLVRFHPGTPVNERNQVEQELASLTRSNYEVEHSTAFPIYGVMRNVDWNLTTRSTTVREAADFGVPSIITDPVGLTYYKDLVEESKAFSGTDAEGILSTLSSERSFERKHLHPTPVQQIELDELLLETLQNKIND